MGGGDGVRADRGELSSPSRICACWDQCLSVITNSTLDKSEIDSSVGERIDRNLLGDEAETWPARRCSKIEGGVSAFRAGLPDANMARCAPSRFLEGGEATLRPENGAEFPAVSELCPGLCMRSGPNIFSNGSACF